MLDLETEFKRASSGLAGAESFDALAERDRVLVSIWCLEADVNNGGFHQYYFNGAGDYAFYVVEALEKIGAVHMAAIVRDANACFGLLGPARSRSDRQRQLADITAGDEDGFEVLGSRFFAYPDDIASLLRTFLTDVP